MVAAGGGADSGISGTPTMVMALIPVVLLISVIFEKIEHSLKHHTSVHSQPVLSGLFQELTILGVWA